MDNSMQQKCKEGNMKKVCFGLIFILFIALVTAVFAFASEFGFGGPPVPGPYFSVPPIFGPVGPWASTMDPEGPDNNCGRPPRGFHGNGPMKYLNLSKEQMEKMREMADRSFQETRDLRYELLQKGLELQKMFADPDVDEATLLAKQKEVDSLHQTIMEKSMQAVIKGRKILTPEQIKKLEQIQVGHMGFGPMGMQGW
jgi:Spy/CpxP family protein refolding chaperone